jgi:hypothetical protein
MPTVQSNDGCAQCNLNVVQQLVTASLNVLSQHFSDEDEEDD